MCVKHGDQKKKRKNFAAKDSQIAVEGGVCAWVKAQTVQHDWMHTQFCESWSVIRTRGKALHMQQTKDVQKSSVEGCALGIGQKLNGAAVTDA